MEPARDPWGRYRQREQHGWRKELRDYKVPGTQRYNKPPGEKSRRARCYPHPVRYYTGLSDYTAYVMMSCDVPELIKVGYYCGDLDKRRYDYYRKDYLRCVHYMVTVTGIIRERVARGMEREMKFAFNQFMDDATCPEGHQVYRRRDWYYHGQESPQAAAANLRDFLVNDAYVKSRELKVWQGMDQVN